MSVRLRHAYSKITFPIALAMVVVGGAVVFWLQALAPAERRLAALEAAISARSAARASAAARVQGRGAVAAQLGQFYAFFGGELTYVDWLARFYAAGGATGVVAHRVEYRSTEPSGIPLVLYELSVPVVADYSKVRAFSETVLNNVPIASLDQVTFRRLNSAQSEVEANLRFTFYLPRR